MQHRWGKGAAAVDGQEREPSGRRTPATSPVGAGWNARRRVAGAAVLAVVVLVGGLTACSSGGSAETSVEGGEQSGVEARRRPTGDDDALDADGVARLQLIVAALARNAVSPPTTAPPPAPAPPPTEPPAPAPPAGGTPSPAWPAPGNPGGGASVPGEAQAADTSHPDHVVGNGTPGSCTSQAVVDTVAQGGVITFDCGPEPVTITMQQTAKIRNDTGPEIVIDGGGKVTLSGGGARRILYMNTCDEAQVHTTSHCQDQDHPRLTVQNITFADGNSTGDATEGGGGGAIFVRGGRLKVVASRFVRNRCDTTGPDLGGAAIRVLSQSQGLPVYVVNSTFGGAAGDGGSCSNGGALSSIGVSWEVLNSVLSHNEAIGNGANPARGGTPGGGSGGAIYADGNTMTVHVAGTIIEDNHAKEGGGAIFFVSNDRSGHLAIDGGSTLRRNPSDGFETGGLPGIFYLGSGNASTAGASLG